MPWLTNDIIFIEAKQEYLEQTLVNTFFYRIIDIVGTAILNALIDLLVGTIINYLLPLQNDLLEHVEQVTTNLTDGLTQHVTVHNVDGLGSSSDPVASFIALGLKKSVSTRLTRPGSIRIAGLNEPNIDRNDLVPGYATLAVLAGLQLSDTLIIDDLEDTVATFNPVVVGRDEEGHFDIARVNDLTVMGQPRLTTQNSRKPER